MEDHEQPVKAVSSTGSVSASQPDSRHNLILTSYGHANGPLDNSGYRQLKFSVRDLPNPPAALRRTHTGLSARLRKEVLATSKAKLRLSEIEAVILEAMDQCEQDVSQVDDEGDNRRVETTGEGFATLQVGICCEEGKHRSVSMVHELARSAVLERPGWNISEDHRDVSADVQDSQGASPVLPKAHARRVRGRKAESRRSGAFPEDNCD
jgi:RNase adaptor protein for sRNA GlmZ degradation